MKYYSELTKKMYDSVEDLENAEKEVSDRAANRKRDAEEVEKAYNALVEAKKNLDTVLKNFCSKYGTYHRSIKSTDGIDNTGFFDLLKFW